MGKLWNFFLNLVAVTVALFFVVLLVPGIDIVPPPPTGEPGIGATNEQGYSPTFIAVAIIFILVNTFLTPVLRRIGAPLTCATLGLFALVINGATLLIVEWVFTRVDLGLQLGLGQFRIGSWGAAIAGAVVLGLVSGVVNFFTSPLRARA